MPNISSPLGTSSASMPLVRPDQRNRLAGTLILFNTVADLNAAVALERTNIANGVPMWATGQPLAVAREQEQGLYRVWNAAGQHARTLILRPGVSLILAADAGVVGFASGAPAAGAGADGDVSIDWAANQLHVKAAGAWVVSPVSPFPAGSGGGASTSADITDATAAGRTLLTSADAAAQRAALGLGSVSNLAPADLPVSTATAAALAGKADLSGGKLLVSQLPEIALTQYLGSVASEAAMLALVGQAGDWVVRSDLGTNWIISGANPAALSDWTQLSYPASPVTSVAGKTGAVDLNSGDLSDGTAAGRSMFSAASAAAQRTLLGLGTAASASASSFAAAAHGHASAEITDFTEAARDAAASALLAGTHSGIAVSYDDLANSIVLSVPAPSLKTINGQSIFGSGDIVISGAPADSQSPSMIGSVSVSSVTDTGFTLTWSAASDNTGVTAYEYSINGGGTYTQVGLALTVSITGLTASTTYAVRVRALDAAGNAATPLAVSVTTTAAPDNTAPTLAGSITFTNITDTTATLDLPLGADNVAVAGYRYSLNGGVSWIDLFSARTVNLTGLSANTAYPVRAVAYDAAGNSSAELNATLNTAAPAPAGNGLQQAVEALALGQWILLTAPAQGGINGNLCTVSISADVMTVTSTTQASIGAGQYVVAEGAALPAIQTDTKIVEQLTGTPRGAGTYRVSISQNVASRQVHIQGRLPRTRYYFDGNELFPSDAAVNSNQGANGGGVGIYMIDGYSAIRMNPATGQVVYRGGGHGNGSDGTIYGFDFRDGPGRTWRALVPGGKLRSASEQPPAWWNAVSQPATLVTTTASGNEGQNFIVVASSTGIVASSNGAFIYAAEGGIPSGAAVLSVDGTTITLSKNLTQTFSNRAVRYTRAAYWVSENVNGHQVPPAAQMYGCSAFLPGTDTLVLGAGQFVAGGDYQGNIGAGWAYSPSYASNGGMIGPFQLAYSPTARHPELARYGYCLQGAFAGPGLTIPCDLDGKLYTFGRTYNDGNNFPALWRWDNPLSAPTAAWVGNGVYRIGVPCAYFVNNAVCFPDPKFAGNTKRAIFHDQKRIHGSPRFVIWSDITGTPVDYLVDWTPPDIGWNNSGGHAPGYCWNSDKGVMAVTDGIDVWEFPITFNGTNYVAGTITKLTAAATGDVPTLKSSDVGYSYATLDYYSPAKCYLHAQNFAVRVIRAE